MATSIIMGLFMAVMATSAKPNIFLLLTDDQDVLLGGLVPMTKLQKLLVAKGTTFSNAMVHTPICCPSRSSYLSGRYLHNSLTFRNDPADGCGNISWAEGPEKDTYAVHAQATGYVTHYAGKYLNSYGNPGSFNCSGKGDQGCNRTPPGWDDWHGLVGNSRYYNASIVSNGIRKAYGDNTHTDYAPDLFFNHTRDFLSNHLATASGKPFLAVLATPSCHGPFTPADKYKGVFANSSAPITPNYNHSNDDKQWIMRHLSPITQNMALGIDNQHNMRWETLLSVDDYIETIINMLEHANQMDNTYFVYTSDHGFQLGQHRLPGDKRHPYQHDLRIPFIVRGPGVAEGVSDMRVVLNIDVAPTFVEIATGSVPDTYDGRSFYPMLKADGATLQPRSDFLVAYHGDYKACGLQLCPPPPLDNFHVIDGKNNTYQCVRTLNVSSVQTFITNNNNTNNNNNSNYDNNNDNDYTNNNNMPSSVTDSLYCEFVDSEHFVEYYDHTTDPWQLSNLAYNTTTNSNNNNNNTTKNTTNNNNKNNYNNDNTPPALKPLANRLALFRTCKGIACRDL